MIGHIRLGKPSAALAGLSLIIALTASGACAESLQQAWDAALAADRGVKASQQNTAATESMLEAAKSARLPNVALEAGYTALDNTPAAKAEFFGQSLQMPLAQRESMAYKAMVTLPLYTGGRIERGIDAAVASRDAAKLAEPVNVQNLKLRVAEAYVGVLRARQLLSVAKSHLATLAEHVHDVENLHAQGMAAKNDLLSAQVSLADARQRELQAANGYDIGCAAYSRLLGRPLDQAVGLDELSVVATNETLLALTERALVGRGELAAQAKQIETLHHQAASVRGESAPMIALSGGYDYQENRYQVREGAWMLNLGIKWKLFDGGDIAHRASAVERQAAALAEQREEVASIIALQVRQAWSDVREARQRLDVTQSAIALADENLRVARDRYANGLSTHTEVLDAETLRIVSQTNHANARYDANLAELRLKRTIGGL